LAFIFSLSLHWNDGWVSLKTLDLALCLFAVGHERLGKLRHLGRLGYLGKSLKNLLFRAVNILLRQNRSLSVFSTMGISSDM
jgi:hypothetical protein